MRRILALAIVSLGCGGTSGRSPTIWDEVTQAECADRARTLWQGVADLAAQSAVGCTTDSDCVIVRPVLRCQEYCAASILASQQDRFAAELASYADSACLSYPHTCGLTQPSCARADAICNSGTCGMR